MYDNSTPFSVSSGLVIKVEDSSQVHGTNHFPGSLAKDCMHDFHVRSVFYDNLIQKKVLD